MLKTTIKTFEDLTLRELYDLLQLRSEIFVVEQQCIYLDIDGKDHKALHVLGYEDNQLVAYARIFKAGDYFEETAIGRVAVKADSREKSFGYEIMKASIQAAESRWNSSIISVSAQSYLRKFYKNLGFEEEGEEYLEDDIPHVRMIRTNYY